MIENQNFDYSLEFQSQVEGEQIDAIKETLMEHMANAEVLTQLGKPVITWKSPKANYRIDTKRLSLEHPKLVKVYQSLVINSRRFVVRDLPDELIPHELNLEENIRGSGFVRKASIRNISEDLLDNDKLQRPLRTQTLQSRNLTSKQS